jgi:hypothetical protein
VKQKKAQQPECSNVNNQCKTPRVEPVLARLMTTVIKCQGKMSFSEVWPGWCFGRIFDLTGDTPAGKHESELAMKHDTALPLLFPLLFFFFFPLISVPLNTRNSNPSSMSCHLPAV